MYTRSPTSDRSRDLHIPRNYSGNAFAPPQAPPQEEIEEVMGVEETTIPADAPSPPSAEESSPEQAAPAAKLFPSLGISSRISRLFGNLGTEELLILGVILLLAGNEGIDDLLLLLILLLFIR